MKKLIECPACKQMIDSRGMRLHPNSKSCLTAQGQMNNKGGSTGGKCKHENKRLLNSSDRGEKAVMDKFGVTELCLDCEEIL